MKIRTVLLMLFLLLGISKCDLVYSESVAPDFSRIVDGIYRIEGGSRAKSPYGILSVRCRSKEHCREICERTVRNNYRRWVSAGRPGEFFDFLADKYCPPSVDPVGNKRWKKNIRSVMR